ncbi:MAG TPA: hypothetical protein VHB21_18010, partial [Minicystis sp.]|nr:hypothetical protein [Minicystis sp.]
GWAPFRNTAPPAVAADETGVDNGTSYDVAQVRAYAWGKRGADWTRAGRWLVRFDDRFDPTGGVRSTAITSSPWADENVAAEAIGTGSYNTTQWTLGEGRLIDPSGRAALAAGCHGGQCTLYALAEGQPVQPLRDANGRVAVLPRPSSAVRVGETWFFLVPFGGYGETMTLYRVDLGVARPLATWHRPMHTRMAGPVLVRRARSGALGVLSGVPAEPSERHGSWSVLPIDQESGELGEPIVVGKKDFGGKPLERCAAGQDGWLLDTETDLPAPIDVVGATASTMPLELRLRLDPGFACVEGLATRIDGVLTKTRAPAKAPVRIDDATALPLAATERGTGRRWALRCALVRGR